MPTPETSTLRRRSWLALCIGSLLAACGGGESGTAVWDQAAWNGATWQ